MVAGALLRATGDTAVVQELLRALEASQVDARSPNDAAHASAHPNGATARERLKQQLQQRRLRARIQSAKEKLNGYLDRLHSIKKGFFFDEPAPVNSDAIRAKLVYQLEALASWQGEVLRDPLVMHASGLAHTHF